MIALKHQFSSGINAQGTKDPPPLIDMMVPTPNLCHPEAQCGKGMVQLDDCNTLKEEVDLVVDVVEGIIS